jgi:hypothetical protein
VRGILKGSHPLRQTHFPQARKQVSFQSVNETTTSPIGDNESFIPEIILETQSPHTPLSPTLPTAPRQSQRTRTLPSRYNDYVLPPRQNLVRRTTVVAEVEPHPVASTPEPHAYMTPVKRAFASEIEVRPPLRLQTLSSNQFTALDSELHERLGELDLYRKITSDLDVGVSELTTAIYNIAAQYSAMGKQNRSCPPRPNRRRPTKSVQALTKAVTQTRRDLRRMRGTAQPELMKQLRHSLELLKRAKKADEYEDRSRKCVAETKKYRENPWQYVKKLGTEPTVHPTFTQAQCEEYLEEVLADPDYDKPYLTPDWAPEPPTVKRTYKWFPLTTKTITDCLKRRPNKSSPGADGIPYLVYKRCSHLLPYLKHVYREQQRQQRTPLSNGIGIAKMLYKGAANATDTDPTAQPTNFRRICLSNTIGKLFMCMFCVSIGAWATEEGVLDTTVQKGFVAKMSGCIEHSQHVAAALRHARMHQLTIILLFFDLKAAFDNVAHGLIMWALHRYSIPEPVQRLIQQHYATLRLCVVTKDFVTKACRQEKGVMQGDPLSTFIFNLSQNLLGELAHNPTLVNEAYQFSPTLHRLLTTLFADDLLGASGTVSGANVLAETFMKVYSFQRSIVNTKKSLVMAMGKCRQDWVPTQEEHASMNGRVKVHYVYTQFDPRIAVNGACLPCVSDTGIKYLGRRVYYSSSLAQPEQLLTDKLNTTIAQLDSSHLPEVLRTHALKLKLPSLLNWEFAVYPFSRTFVNKLDAIVRRAVKRWLTLPRGTTMQSVFLPTTMRGLGVPCVNTLFEARQTNTLYTLRTSKDAHIRELADMEDSRLSHSKRWTAQPMVRDYVRMTEEEQQSRKGLSAWVKETNMEKRWDALKELTVQNRGVIALEAAGSDDRVWMDGLLALPSHLLRYQTKALLDVLPTNANLFRWKKRADNLCGLCHKYETIAHVLNNCQPCLDKYRWRHDSVLKVIASFCEQSLVPGCEMYVDLAPAEHKHAMGGAPPAHLLQTEQRPDLLVANRAQRKLAIVELTVPTEHNARDAHVRKTVKYVDLVRRAEESGWSVTFATIEICSRGFIPMCNCSLAMTKLKSAALLCFSRAQLQDLLSKCARTVLAASYWIWASRKSAYIPLAQPLI